jgi:transcriptional regulator with XRE-family HTH domain
MDKHANEYHWKVQVAFLYEIALQKDFDTSYLAMKTGLEIETIDAFFSLEKTPTLDVFLLIANAVGVDFFFRDKEGDCDLVKGFEMAMEKLGRRPNALPKN